MNDWQLVYATDASGAEEYGSLNALRTAVMHAADVKIMYFTGDRWWSRYCTSACAVGSGRGAFVAATCLEAIDTNDVNNGLEIAQPVRLEYHLYNSSGIRSRITGGDLDTTRLKMRWYVRGYHVDFINSLLAKVVLIE